MKRLQRYILELDKLINDPNDGTRSVQIASALDGGPSKQLRQTIPVSKLRKVGAFFTSATLADRALSLISQDRLLKGRVIDPTCGGGDLLLAAARRFKSRRSLALTVADWGDRLVGCDLQPLFVDLAKRRLVLLALSTHGHERLAHKTVDGLFPNIAFGNCLENPELIQSSEVVLLNPPFGRTISSSPLQWGAGLVNAAAVFVDYCATHATPGTKVVAILPEVLRNGHNYRKWRARIGTLANVESIISYGQFDPWADVDVFVMAASIRGRIVNASSVRSKEDIQRKTKRLSDIFDVVVGTVVPHRDIEKGLVRPFAHAKNIPPWSFVRRINERRRYLGKVFTPPFIVVRRTSRPTSRNRAVASIVLGARQVAVENHLLVLIPKDHKKTTCTRGMRFLASEGVNQHLNSTMRCRHLTVGSIRSLPWLGDK